MTSKRVTMSLS